MGEKKSYPYLQGLLRCGIISGAIISIVTAGVVILVIWPMHSRLFLNIFGHSLSGVFIGVGLFLALITLYAATIPRNVPAYLSSRKMMYSYQKTGSGIRLFNKMMMFGTDSGPMACIFVGSVFMILEGVLISFIWG